MKLIVNYTTHTFAGQDYAKSQRSELINITKPEELSQEKIQRYLQQKECCSVVINRMQFFELAQPLEFLDGNRPEKRYSDSIVALFMAIVCILIIFIVLIITS